MPGPLKGPEKFWNIDPIWGYIMLILAINQSINQSFYFSTIAIIHYLQKKIWLLQQCGGELENKPKACLVPDSLIKRLNFYII